MAPTSATLVDTLPLLDECLKDISPVTATATPISLAMDLEGIALSRSGTISIIQIMPNISRKVWLVDVTVLGNEAFDHVDPFGRTLRTVLQNPSIKKILFDVRNDADALFNLYSVDLANVYDLQLLEVAVRRSLKKRDKKVVKGLAHCLEFYVSPPPSWKAVKDVGRSLFAPEQGGSYSVFDERPMDPRIFAYCAQDVELLFQLESVLERRLGRKGSNWRSRILGASATRVAEARSAIPEKGKRVKRILAPPF